MPSKIKEKYNPNNKYFSLIFFKFEILESSVL